jgi:hypothetical protein
MMERLSPETFKELIAIFMTNPMRARVKLFEHQRCSSIRPVLPLEVNDAVQEYFPCPVQLPIFHGHQVSNLALRR